MLGPRRQRVRAPWFRVPVPRRRGQVARLVSPAPRRRLATVAVGLATVPRLASVVLGPATVALWAIPARPLVVVPAVSAASRGTVARAGAAAWPATVAWLVMAARRMSLVARPAGVAARRVSVAARLARTPPPWPGPPRRVGQRQAGRLLAAPTALRTATHPTTGQVALRH